MDSVKIFKGYDKVLNPLEDQPSTTHKTHPPNHRKPLIAVVIVLLTVIIGSMIGALIHESTTEIPDSSAESITTVCSVTHYPNSCYTAISSLCNSQTDPELIFTLSLKVSLNELRNLSSLPKTLISKSNDARSESALNDCASLFNDAVSRLNDSLRALEVGPGERMLNDEKIGDLNTWISAAMTYQETCLDGLEEMGSSVVGEVRDKVQKSKEYMSNSLAILANMQTVLDKFHLTMH